MGFCSYIYDFHSTIYSSDFKLRFCVFGQRFFGKALIQPQAPQLTAWDWGGWTDAAALRAALQVNVLLPAGLLLAVVLHWALGNTRWGLLLRMAGDSATAARSLGYSVNGLRLAATTVGGMVAGLGGACLSLD